MIEVNIRSPDPGIAKYWDLLVSRVPSANVFMHPAALSAAAATKFAKVHVLLAWNTAVGPRQLVGVWALTTSRVARVWPAVLLAPAYEYAFLSSPVIDPAFADDVIPAFFRAIATDPALPNVIRIKYLDAECEAGEAMLGALCRPARQHLVLSQRARAFVSRDTGLKRSGSTRKKLRQDWNRLSAIGAVDIALERTQAGVRDAFETFLAMEANSWKGAEGTALLCDRQDAAFVRRLVGDLAAGQNAAVALLRLDGRPIAAQVLLYCGRMAYTWKTAFDPNYGKYSPGVLLVDKLTDQLFFSGDIDAIESCSPDGSFMDQLWAGRRTTVDLLLDVGTGRSPGFTVAAIDGRVRLLLRAVRNKLRERSWFPDAGRRALATLRQLRTATGL